MKLSDAILIGSAVVKPKPGKIYHLDENAGCAIGMAVVGAGGRWIRRGLESVEFLYWWPWVKNFTKRPCRCQSVRVVAPVKHLIPHLFDRHVFGQCDWTIEQLAQWIATIEPPEQDHELLSDVPIDVVGRHLLPQLVAQRRALSGKLFIQPRPEQPKPEGPDTVTNRTHTVKA